MRCCHGQRPATSSSRPTPYVTRDQGKSTLGRADLAEPVHGDGPAGSQVGVPGIHTVEPTFGLPATWVDAALKEEASLRAVGAATVRSTHLTGAQSNMSIAVYGQCRLLKELPKEQAELVGTSCRARSRSPASSACCSSCSPSVSIRDLSTILEGIADALYLLAQSLDMVEHIPRSAGAPDLAQNTSYNDLPLIALSARWGDVWIDRRPGPGPQPRDASKLSEFMTAVRNAFEQAARGRGAGAGDVGRDTAIRALAGRRFRSQTPCCRRRNPPAGSAEDGRKCVANLATRFEVTVCSGSPSRSLNLFRGLSEHLGRAAFPPHANGLSE